jgi:mannose-6-phosphate isomerase
VTAWLVPIAGSVEVAGVSAAAGQCATMTGSETVTTSADADILCAYPLTQRI